MGIIKKKQSASLEAILKINEIMKGSGLDSKSITKAKHAIKTIAGIHKITQDEALILAAIIETCGSSHNTGSDELARFFRCSNVQIMIYGPVFASLVEKGFIRSYYDFMTNISYKPANGLMKAIQTDTPFARHAISNLNLQSFLIEYSKLADERHNDHLDYEIFSSELGRLINSNTHLQLCKFLIKNIGYGIGKRNELATIFILRACTLSVVYNCCTISKNECDRLFDDDYGIAAMPKILKRLSNQNCDIQVFEPAIPSFGSLADSNSLCLTSTFCNDILEGFNIEKNMLENEVLEGIIFHDKIVQKRLFYNTDEADRISEIEKLLKPRNFKRIQTRLNEYGYRKGFASLFYGAPGTGKTETAMQLARATGRNIISVDLSQVRDKYVGESEKRTKAIFDHYRRAMQESKQAPILLLNEADGLLSKRFSAVDHSTDQMENTMQNIILQELEAFEGILIATTNLTCNLDSAFERRFLYKIEFRKPSAKVRQSIWCTMIHDLKPSDAMVLAEEFDFSGGEIENIARKYVIDTILHDKKTDIDSLRQMCSHERLATAGNRKRIGFDK